MADAVAVADQPLSVWEGDGGWLYLPTNACCGNQSGLLALQRTLSPDGKVPVPATWRAPPAGKGFRSSGAEHIAGACNGDPARGA